MAEMAKNLITIIQVNMLPPAPTSPGLSLLDNGMQRML